jgi:hypothetical protein
MNAVITQQPKILVIIPACNEELNIKRVIDNLRKEAPEADYIIINDCSKDKTREVCRNNNLNYIDLPINLGIGGGVQAGYQYALEKGYDIAIQHDGDGQHDPSFLKAVVSPILDGKADIVIGSRFVNCEGFQSSFFRRMGINILSRLIELCCGVRVKDVTSGYRGVNRKFIEIYAGEYAQDYPEPEAIISGAMYGAKIIEVPVVMHERIGGTSSISTWKSIYYMIKVSLAIIIYRPSLKRRY